MHMSLLFTAASLAGAFSGLLVSSILGVQDTKVGSGSSFWCVIASIRFHVSPIATAWRGLKFVFVGRDFYWVFGPVTFFILPRTPTSSQFLTGKEKEAIHAALDQEWTPDSGEEVFSWKQAVAAFTTPTGVLHDCGFGTP